MTHNTKKSTSDALKVISSTIVNCEKMHPKFAVGTSQHTLLTNRINALYIAKKLITKDESIRTYTKEDLTKALPPITSIISKTEKAQSKYESGTTTFNRFEPLIQAMHLSKSLLENEIQSRM